MRVVHLADLHLGFRQYQRLTPAGINQREADVAETVQRAFAQVVALAPELIVVGGDVFHVARPSNPTILQAYRLFAGLRDALPDTPIVMVAGNHDAPRTAETGCLLGLFREIGILVADERAEVYPFPSQDLVVMAVPDVPGIERPPLLPPPGFTHRVLLMHGEIAGMLPVDLDPAERATVEIPVDALHAERWSCIALGHYHVCREVAPRAWYSGSLDYTSTNPWGELREERQLGLSGKGFLEHDLVAGTHRFHPIAPARPLLELEPIDASGMRATDLDGAIAARVAAAPGGIEERIVRVVVREVARERLRELDHAALRDYRRRAMHFQLDTRPPTAVPRSATGGGAAGRRQSFPDRVAEQLRHWTLPPAMDRDAFVALGMHYLQRADEAVLAAMPAPEP